MHCLVTGATGHLGANLVRRLLRDGHAVRVLVLDPNARENAALAGLAVDRVVGDIRNLDAMREAVRGASEVFHAAAKISTITGGEREIYDINVLGTRNVLRAAREAGVRRVVVTGSFSAVGHTPERPSREEDPFFPFDEHLPYAFTKAFVEQECWTAAAAGQDVVVATSCALLGPHDYFPSRMGAVLRDFANGKMRAYIPGGFDFVAARDICEGHVLAMEKGTSGQKYIFSTRFVEVDELMSIMSHVTGQPLPPLRLPPVVMSGIAHVSTFVLTRFFPKAPLRFTPFAVRYLQMRRRADTSKAQKELGFVPTSIEDAIQDAYDDFVARGEVVSPKKPPRRTRASLDAADPPEEHKSGANGASVGALSSASGFPGHP